MCNRSAISSVRTAALGAEDTSRGSSGALKEVTLNTVQGGRVVPAGTPDPSQVAPSRTDIRRRKAGAGARGLNVDPAATQIARRRGVPQPIKPTGKGSSGILVNV